MRSTSQRYGPAVTIMVAAGFASDWPGRAY